MSISKESSIIIIGSGVFGLSTAYNLTNEGYKNITIYDKTDLYAISYLGGNTASADLNKVFRSFYGNEEHYHKLAIESRKIFEQWDKELQSPELDTEFVSKVSRLKIIDDSGLIRLNTEITDHELKNLDTFSKSGLRHTQFILDDEEDVARGKGSGWEHKLNLFDVGKYKGVLDSTSGILYASRACTYVQFILRKRGVRFITGGEQGQVKQIIQTDDGVVKGIETEDGVKHYADLTILAAGPWSAKLLPELTRLSEAQSGNVIHLKIPNVEGLQEKYSPKNFPILLWKVNPTDRSGIGIFPLTVPENIMKIIVMRPKFRNPTPVGNEGVHTPSIPLEDESRITKVVISKVKEFISEFFPDLISHGTKIFKTEVLWYTDAINNNFIIDYVPSRKNLVVVTGGSGHGFKFLPNLGKFVVRLLEGHDVDGYLPIFKWRDPETFEDINGIRDSDRILKQQEFATAEDLQLD
ncbi:FAD dependent oxidoreductase [Scheffersomyces amazonensis]|uniref:FAD dependent oxidoreductase n=1 Tax=Scheffersomyces amazonensis TaxID=1078765 RepID=UPI00315CF4EA